ncbi:transmembrane protein 208-like [Ruditapes philippinarum]|uniref:transmembrane protein 208-like n=1 Tax=Ruditapes philippinarum TaxID=129788 RepID=UPI00295BC854|nr:transmembrane protein 208-like [Ruditapes philippinarum]
MPPKGKQGTKGQKQIETENKQTLSFYMYIVLCVNVLFYGVQYILFSESFTTFYIVLSLLALCVYGGCYKFMSSMAGQGIDINMESGMAEHAKDVLLLTAIVETLALISNYFWLFWFVAPGRAFYLLWVNILSPWFFQEAPEVDEKKQKKMDRKLKRQQR